MINVVPVHMLLTEQNVCLVQKGGQEVVATTMLIVAINNMPDAHILSFDFDVLPALHIETTKFVLTSIQLAATIFSLIASATKAFSMLKRKISFNLDKVLLGRDDVPEDVQRRTDYLNETNLMHRHFKKMMKHHGLESKRDSALDDKGKCKN